MDTTMQIYLIAFGITIALAIYAIIRKRWQWIETLVPLFFLLLIPILIGINTSNPDHIIWIQVAIP